MIIQSNRRAISPAIATIALIAVAAVAATIAGSDMIRRATMSQPTALPVEVSEIFMIKLSDTRAHLHAVYRIQPGWATVNVSFVDDSGATVSFNLPDSTSFDSAIDASVTIGERYNFIITATGNDGNSATVTMPVFVR